MQRSIIMHAIRAMKRIGVMEKANEKTECKIEREKQKKNSRDEVCSERRVRMRDTTQLGRNRTRSSQSESENEMSDQEEHMQAACKLSDNGRESGRRETRIKKERKDHQSRVQKGERARSQ